MATLAPAREEPAHGVRSPRRDRRWSGPRLCARVHWLSLLLGLPALLWLGRDTWFRADEWLFVLGHAVGPRPVDVFAPVDIHWNTVPILVYRALGAAFGARTYLPYVALTVLLHVVICHLLWRVLLRCGVTGWIATGAAAVFLVLGAGFEAVFWAFSVSYELPLAFALGAVLLADRDALSARRIAVVSALAVLGLMCSGVGLAMAVVPILLIAGRHGLRQAVAAAIAPAAILALWLGLTNAAVLNQPGSASGGSYAALPGFVWSGLVASLGGLVGLVALAVAGLVALACWLAWRGRSRALPPAVLACATGAVLNSVLTAVGRGNGGDPTTSRYLYIGAALLLPAVALALSDLATGLRRGSAVVAAALLAMGGQAGVTLVGNVDTLTAQEQYGHMLIRAAISNPSAVLPDSVPAPGTPEHALSGSDALLLRDRGDLQPLAHIPAAVASLVGRTTHVQLLPAGVAPPVQGAMPVIDNAAQAAVTVDGACTVVGSSSGSFSVDLDFASSGSVRVIAITPMIARLALPATGSSSADELYRELLSPGSSRVLEDTLAGTSLTFTSTLPGAVRFCP